MPRCAYAPPRRGRESGRPRQRRREPVPRTGAIGYSVDTPRSSSIAATEPFSGIEELGGDRLPATELLDREQARRIRELVLVLGEDLLVNGAVAVLGPAALALLGEQVVAERLAVIGVRRVGRDHAQRLDQDRVVGDDVLDVLAGV